jgi:hypothetical protein
MTDRVCMKVWIYVDTSKQVGHREHLKVFANQEAALAWFELNDPEGVAFEYEVRRALTTTREAHDRFQQQVDHILENLRRNA